MTMMKKGLSLFLAVVMVLLTVPSVGFVINGAQAAESLPENYLGLKTELYTYDEVINDWVVAEEVSRNQEVKARVFIDTGFAAGDGNLMFFYNDAAFESDYVGNIFPIVVNDSADSTTGKYTVNGLMTAPAKTHPSIEEMIQRGYLTHEFLAENTPVTFSFLFTDYKCHRISGDDWFAEFTLRAKSDAVGKGDFFVVPETLQNPNEGYFAYSTLSKGVEGGSSLYDTLGMDMWEAECYLESHPVSTGYGRLMLNAGDGIFASNQADSVYYDYPAGTPVSSVEEPAREGYIFVGYDPEIPEVITDDVYVSNAVWIAANDTPVTVNIHYYDFSSGITLEKDKQIIVTGTTGHKIEITDEMPENPDPDTVYYTFSYFAPEYNQINDSADNILSAVIAPDGSSTLELFYEPVIHEVVFDANGGHFNDGTTKVLLEVTHGDYLDEYVIPSNPVREQCNFNGWAYPDDFSRVESDIFIYASWEIISLQRYAIYYEFEGDVPDGVLQPPALVLTEGEEFMLESVPEVEGYEFSGWYYNGVLYTPGSTITMPSHEITVVGLWTKLPEETTQVVTTTVPDVTVPTTEFITTRPFVTEPTTTRPVATEPATTVPATTETTTADQTTTVPATAPVVTEPSTTVPVTVPATTRPVVTEPSTTRPAVTVPLTTVPVETTIRPAEPTTRPVEPTTRPAEPTTRPADTIVSINIRTPSLTTIKYGDSIILHADVTGEIPQGAKIVWESDNQNFKVVSTSADGKTCTITPNTKGDSEFTASIVDSNNNVIVSDTQKMTSKAGFFQKIIAFFKKLFGLTKVYPEFLR